MICNLFCLRVRRRVAMSARQRSEVISGGFYGRKIDLQQHTAYTSTYDTRRKSALLENRRKITWKWCSSGKRMEGARLTNHTLAARGAEYVRFGPIFRDFPALFRLDSPSGMSARGCTTSWPVLGVLSRFRRSGNAAGRHGGRLDTENTRIRKWSTRCSAHAHYVPSFRLS